MSLTVAGLWLPYGSGHGSGSRPSTWASPFARSRLDSLTRWGLTHAGLPFPDPCHPGCGSVPPMGELGEVCSDLGGNPWHNEGVRGRLWDTRSLRRGLEGEASGPAVWGLQGTSQEGAVCSPHFWKADL